MEAKFKVGYIDEESIWKDTFQRNLEDDFDVVIFGLSEDTTLASIVQEVISAKLDCLVVDYELKESSNLTFNGDEIIERLRESNPEFPVLIITGHQEDEIIPNVDDTDIVRSKDELAEKTALFSARLKKKIILYQRQVSDIEEKIQVLSKKKTETTLSIAEEDELNDLFSELDRINPDEKLLPDVMNKRSAIGQLSELLRDTQNILQIIKEKK